LCVRKLFAKFVISRKFFRLNFFLQFGHNLLHVEELRSMSSCNKREESGTSSTTVATGTGA
jgi:hypothetical protein